jgi:hypothetical protein
VAEDQLATQPRPRDLFVVIADEERFGAPNAQVAHHAANEPRHRFPGGDFSWMLVPDAPAPADFCGRYRRLNGLAESRRVAHLFLLPPGIAVNEATVLTGLCSASIRADLLEVLPGMANGMPCYSCLALIPVPSRRTAGVAESASASVELGPRHTEPNWSDIDSDPGPETPIARAIWADLNQKCGDSEDSDPAQASVAKQSPTSSPPDNDWFTPVLPSSSGAHARSESSCSPKGGDVSDTQWYA